MAGIVCVLAEDRSKHTQPTAQKGFSFSHYVTYGDRVYDTEGEPKVQKIVPFRTYRKTLTMTLDGTVWLTLLSVRFIPFPKAPIPVYYEAAWVQGRFGRFGN